MSSFVHARSFTVFFAIDPLPAPKIADSSAAFPQNRFSGAESPINYTTPAPCKMTDVDNHETRAGIPDLIATSACAHRPQAKWRRMFCPLLSEDLVGESRERPHGSRRVRSAHQIGKVWRRRLLGRSLIWRRWRLRFICRLDIGP